jgi:hypothetical protein
MRDEVWEVIGLLSPEEPPKPKGGRPHINDRTARTGIQFVLKTCIPFGCSFRRNPFP